MSKLNFRVLTVIVSLFYVAVCHGATYIDTFDSDATGWTMKDMDGNSPSDLSALGGTYGWNAGGYLSLSLDTDDTRPYQDLLFYDNTTYGDYFAADYISFDFYAKDTGQGPGNAVKLYAYVEGNGVGWINEITSVTLDAWTSYIVGFGFDSGSGWGRLDAASRTSSAWASSIASIDEIGIMLWYQDNTLGQVYGLDNFAVVPEPEVILMLGFALVSLAVTFRKEIQDSLVRVRESIS